VDGRAGPALVTGDPAVFEFRIKSPAVGIRCAFTIYDSLGQGVSSFDVANPAPNDLASKVRLELPLRDRHAIAAARPLSAQCGAHRIGRHGRRPLGGSCLLRCESGFVDGREASAQAGYGHVETHTAGFPHEGTGRRMV
jgi:hypothetical protein